MSEWYVLLAFVAGVWFGQASQHLTIRLIKRAELERLNNEHSVSKRPPP